MVLGTTLAFLSFARSKAAGSPERWSSFRGRFRSPSASSPGGGCSIRSTPSSTGRWSTSAWSALSTSRTGWEIRTLRLWSVAAVNVWRGAIFGHHHHGRSDVDPPELLEAARLDGAVSCSAGGWSSSRSLHRFCSSRSVLGCVHSDGHDVVYLLTGGGPVIARTCCRRWRFRWAFAPRL